MLILEKYSCCIEHHYIDYQILLTITNKNTCLQSVRELFTQRAGHK